MYYKATAAELALKEKFEKQLCDLCSDYTGKMADIGECDHALFEVKQAFESVMTGLISRRIIDLKEVKHGKTN